MAKCVNCNKNISNAYRFSKECPHCGAPLVCAENTNSDDTVAPITAQNYKGVGAEPIANSDMSNRTAKLLKAIGYATIICGIFAGIGYASTYKSLVLFIYWVIGGIVSGALFLGFAEVINLLQEIANRK
jgi:hypothetical protein